MNDSISCYSEAVNNGASFIDYGNLTRSGCRTLFSAISMESFGGSSAVSLDVQMVRIGWWLLGECRCSENARCLRVSPPVDGNPAAYRCQCEEGFAGDGFRDGLGCRKESQGCNASKYLSGQCGGTTRVGVLVGGCSIENEEQILVYEFMPNGTLSQHLQTEKGSKLPWPVRLTIASETAQAISYLHNSIHPPIYHRDIKSSNILLDYNYKSKVADFGLSRLGLIESSHISTAPQGTPGYLDPQYHQNFQLSDKSDVYSFGVVLVEIVTGLRVVDFSRSPDEINLATVAVDRIGRGCLDEIIDPFILGGDRDNWTISSVDKVAELAFRCLAFHRDMRPSMMEVAIELEQIRLSKWTDSEMSVTTSDSFSSDYSKKSLNPTVENECQAIQDSW